MYHSLYLLLTFHAKSNELQWKLQLQRVFHIRISFNDVFVIFVNFHAHVYTRISRFSNMIRTWIESDLFYQSIIT